MTHTSYPASHGRVPALTADQMREVDRLMAEQLGIDLPRMAEHAGRHLAHLARSRFLGGSPLARSVAVLVGRGGNGGGALIAARRLAGWGARVTVLLGEPPERLTPVPAHQLGIAKYLGLRGADGLAPDLPDWRGDLILDGLVGYGLRGAPSGRVADLVRWANAQPAPVLSLDVPTGLDATTGAVSDPCIQATATLTLALPKQGLLAPVADHRVGELYLGDIGVPSVIYRSPSVGVEVGPIFAPSDILRLR